MSTTALTIQLPFNEVQPVWHLVLDCIYVIQQVDLPLLMLSAVICSLSRISPDVFPHLSLAQRATHWSLETLKPDMWISSCKSFLQISAHYSITQKPNNQANYHDWGSNKSWTKSLNHLHDLDAMLPWQLTHLLVLKYPAVQSINKTLYINPVREITDWPQGQSKNVLSAADGR